jgi:hypothetical protein
MKKAIGLVGMGLLLVSMVMIGCAPMQKTVITKDNLPTLQGTWEGWTSWSDAQIRPGLTGLQINKATIPIAGTIIWYNVPERRQYIAFFNIAGWQ